MGLTSRSFTPCGGVAVAPSDGTHTLDMTEETLQIGTVNPNRGRVFSKETDGVSTLINCSHLVRGTRCALTHMFSIVDGQRVYEKEMLARCPRVPQKN